MRHFNLIVFFVTNLKIFVEFKFLPTDVVDDGPK
jgi:hypothetical protein